MWKWSPIAALFNANLLFVRIRFLTTVKVTTIFTLEVLDSLFRRYQKLDHNQNHRHNVSTFGLIQQYARVEAKFCASALLPYKLWTGLGINSKLSTHFRNEDFFPLNPLKNTAARSLATTKFHNLYFPYTKKYTYYKSRLSESCQRSSVFSTFIRFTKEDLLTPRCIHVLQCLTLITIEQILLP